MCQQYILYNRYLHVCYYLRNTEYSIDYMTNVCVFQSCVSIPNEEFYHVFASTQTADQAQQAAAMVLGIDISQYVHILLSV